MTEPTSSSNETAIGLLGKLDKLELTAEEHDLLQAILTVAEELSEITGATDPDDVPTVDASSFSAEFGAAFTPGKVELIKEYAARPRADKLLVAKHLRIGAGAASPALVSRGITLHTETGHDPHSGSVD